MENGALITLMLGGPEDADSKTLLVQLYTGRRIEPVSSIAIALDGGGIGRITQQRPAGVLPQ